MRLIKLAKISTNFKQFLFSIVRLKWERKQLRSFFLCVFKRFKTANSVINTKIVLPRCYEFLVKSLIISMLCYYVTFYSHVLSIKKKKSKKKIKPIRGQKTNMATL